MRNPSTAQDIPYTTGENASLEATYEESKRQAVLELEPQFRVWKLPMRNPSFMLAMGAMVESSSLEATHEESKPVLCP